MTFTWHHSPALFKLKTTLPRDMLKPTLLAFALAFAVQASAEPCIKVRDGSDGTGPSRGYTCMRFTDPERSIAAAFHLRLASPYKEARAKMTRSGWVIDPEWLKDFDAEAKQGLPVCGHGWDAICHIQLKKGKEVVVLTFSGTNRAYPLIAVEPGK
ncbi:hypothetical protein [Cupriavidus pauculus]|jgi:hypothetical protein|uniref:hypothetical protein n=1 Tax=Cupriavidus pauculus TaxID=82633 RepID=UPI0030FC3CE5